MSRRRAPIVLKFGGASLADPARVASAVGRIRAEGPPVVLVVSAREGVTDLLTEALAHPRSRAVHRRVLAEIARRHPNLSPAGRRPLERLRRLLALVEATPRPDGPLADRVLSQGERLAVHWLSGELRRAGFPAVPVEADHLGLITDNAYGASCILFDRSRLAVRRGIGRRLARGELPVVTGYFGRSLEGRVATLGRGGSDYAASGIGAMLGASRVELVKRHVAVLSADPKEVPSARPIPELSYEEAEELAQFGARVLHPLTIEPARAHGIVLRVRSLEEPEVVTTIAPGRADRRNRAFTLLRPLRLLRLRVPGGRQRPGIVAEVSQRLAEARVNLVQLYTSSALLCLVLEPPQVLTALRALAPVTREAAAMVDGPFRVALVTAIGDGILADLDRIPARAVADGEGFSATPRAFSLAVAEARGPDVLRALHRALVEERA
ncbi:MAG TPA: aspartate kinase [Thermoplasmata archaeon]|nr:aspartate kinase [Thermoplasmata archaeon]HTW56397.1 aspartate kinase [Thermoplasmata archaeon]